MQQLLFAVHLHKCERGPFTDDSHDRTESVWEARCVPGNLIGVGRSPQEAQRSLHDLIDWTSTEEASFEAWYLAAWAFADANDVEMFNAVAGAKFRSAQPHEAPTRKPTRTQGVMREAPRYSFGLAQACGM